MELAVKKVRSKRQEPHREATRKKTRPALSKEYQAVFENTGKAMVIVEENATISLANAEFEKLSGYTKKEIEGTKRWTEFVSRDDRKRVGEYHLLRRSDPMLAPRSVAFRFLDRQEQIKNVVLTIGTIPGTNKSMASLLDVNDRRQAEIAQKNSKGQEGEVKVHVMELEKANKALQAEVAGFKREVHRLQESEKRYQILMENIDFGINLIDADYNIVMVNNALSKRRKTSANKLIGEKCFRAFEKRDTVCPHCPGVRAMATGKPAMVETVGAEDDLNRFPSRLHAFPIVREDGTASGFIEVVEDITERNRTDEILRQSEERYRSLAENIKLGISLIDPDHNIIMTNPAQSKQFKKTVNELLGKKCYQEFENRDAVCPHCPGVQAMATGQTVEVEDETVRDDGRRFHVRLQAFPVFRKDGTASGFIEVCEDITKRVRAEEAFRASEERFRMLAENMPLGISVMAPNKRFEYFNPQFTNIFGYTMEDIPDKDTWFEKAYPDETYRKEVSSVWKTDLEKDVKLGEENPRVFTVRCKNGQQKRIDFRTVYLDNGKQYLFYEDVTDRIEAEEKLRQSEDRFRSLIETTMVGVSAIDEKGVITYANERFGEIWGYSIDEIIGRHVFDFLDKENLKILQEHLSKRKKGEHESYEIAWTRKDGRKVPTILAPTPIIDADGRFKGSYGFITDIAERKQMEEQLRQAEDRYRTLVETMKVGLTTIDGKGVITYVNDQVCKMLGYSMEEIIGHPTTDFYDEESRRRQEEIFAKRRKGSKDPTPYEVTWMTKDGRPMHTILTPTPGFSVQGQFTGSFAIFTDITERKHMEEALQKSEALHRTLIETTKVGVSAINESGVITYVNERLCDIWGYALNEITGHRVTEFLDEENLKILQEQLAKRRGGGRDPYEIAWRRKDGKNVSTILAPTPIFDADGHYKGSYGFITDITERMQIEERLQRYAADLERINEEVKNFAYIVSHDLRVPLVNLKGYSAELRTALGVVGANFDAVLPHLAEEKQSEVAMALHEDVPEALKFITTSVSQMDSFINAVLTLSRLGRQDLKPESIDMNTLVRTTMENMSHQIHEREIDVTVGSLPEVVADRTSMEQIMGNILGNAVKYLDPERPGQIKVNAEINNGEQFFRIQDNGRGIAQQDMHKVFTPFRRAGKQDTPGEGMGLAYVQTLVRRHGGRIWCESELGKGTTLTFTIATPSEQRVPDA